MHVNRAVGLLSLGEGNTNIIMDPTDQCRAAETKTETRGDGTLIARGKRSTTMQCD